MHFITSRFLTSGYPWSFKYNVVKIFPLCSGQAHCCQNFSSWNKVCSAYPSFQVLLFSLQVVILTVKFLCVKRYSVWASKNRNRCLRADIWHQQTSTKSTWTTSRSHRRLWQKGSTRDSYWLTTNLQPHRLPQGWVITSVTQAWHRRIPKLASVALLLFLAHLYLRIKSTAILTSFSYRSLKVWATCTVYWL